MPLTASRKRTCDFPSYVGLGFPHVHREFLITGPVNMSPSPRPSPGPKVCVRGPSLKEVSTHCVAPFILRNSSVCAHRAPGQVALGNPGKLPPPPPKGILV